MDNKFENENNKSENKNDLLSKEIGTSFTGEQAGYIDNPNKELKDVLLGKKETHETDTEKRKEDVTQDFYMKTTSEMAHEITPSEDDAGLEKDSEHKILSKEDKKIENSALKNDVNKNTEFSWGLSDMALKSDKKNEPEFSWGLSEMALEKSADTKDINANKEQMSSNNYEGTEDLGLTKDEKKEINSAFGLNTKNIIEAASEVTPKEIYANQSKDNEHKDFSKEDSNEKSKDTDFAWGLNTKNVSEMAREITPSEDSKDPIKDNEHKVISKEEDKKIEDMIFRKDGKKAEHDNDKDIDNKKADEKIFSKDNHDSKEQNKDQNFTKSENDKKENKKEQYGMFGRKLSSGNNKDDKNCKRPLDKTKVATQWVMVGVAVLAAAGFGYGWFTERQRLEMNQNELVGVYYKSFDNVASNMNDLEKKLAKVQIVSSKELYATLFTEIWSTSNALRNDIGQLPLQTDLANDLSKFVTQAGDYCYVLLQNVLNDEEITAEQQEQLYNLQQNCATLANELATLRVENKVVFLSAEEQASVEASTEEEDSPYATIRSDIEQYPTLIYDGPFSDSIKDREIKGLAGQKEATVEQAEEVAKKTAGRNITNITRDEDVEGKIAAYTFTVTYEDGTSSTINVTKLGAKPLYMIQNNVELESAIEAPADEVVAKAKETAKKYLESIGYKNMQPNYVQYYNGTILVNFTTVVDNVTIYPEMIKVWVDVNNFNVTQLDSKRYIYAYTNRNIKSPKLTTAQAKGYVSSNLAIDSSKLCIIPSETFTEDYCYEFSGVYKGLRFLVYIDADTGKETEVMQIIDTDQGELVQ